MKPGEICPMGAVKVKHDNLELGFSPPKRGDRFIFLYLGLWRKGSEPLDPEKALRELGWVPAAEATSDNAQKRELICLKNM